MSPTTTWDPEQYAKDARFVSSLGAPLLEMLAPKPGELILDLGCGDGALTEKIHAFNCAVIAVDSSLAQVKAARKRGLQVVVMDGHDLCFRQTFDAAFTNAALHWMKRPEQVVSGVWNVLKPGGRFVGEFGGKGNIARIHSVLYAALRNRAIDPVSIDPWYYPSAEEYARLLGATGFSVDYIALIPRPTKLPADIRGWLELFGQSFINAVTKSDRRDLLDELARSLEPDLRRADGTWLVDYVRLRFAASKPAA